MKHSENLVICPPCGERACPRGFLSRVALATKRGANKVSPILPLLPRLTAVLPPQGREITTRGFTLIELLVVVLIIGILAAVALPQYQKAVMKSRYATLKNVTQSIARAQETYYLTNGSYTLDFNNLDIEVGIINKKYSQVSVRQLSSGFCALGNDYVHCEDSQKALQYRIYMVSTTNPYQGKQACLAKTADLNAPQNQLCKQETNSSSPFYHGDTETAWLYH